MSEVLQVIEHRLWRLGELTRVRQIMLALSSLILPLIVYLRTMPPTVYGLDSAELSVGAYTLGLVHAPGYPLYLLLGKLFTFIPLGDIGYRLNLMSVIFGVLTIFLVQLMVRRITGQALIALAAALFLAFSWYFWTDAIVAEVYTLQSAFTAGLFYLLLIWRERREARWLYVFALLAGLSAANYPVTGLLAPGLAAFVWLTDRQALLDIRRLVVMAGWFGLGFLVYLYLPLRYLATPPFNYMGRYDATGIFAAANLTDPATLWQMLVGGPFQDLIFGYTFSQAILQAGQYLYFLWGNFLALGLPLGLTGLIYGWRRDRTVVIATGLMFGVYTIFFINYRVVDKVTMFLPSYVIWVLWIAWGYEALVAWIGVTWRPVLQMAFLAVAAVVLVINFPLVDVSWDRRAYQQADDMLAAAEPGALIIGDWGFAAPLEYIQLTEDHRRDVKVINNFFIAKTNLPQLIDQTIQHQPVYVVSVERDQSIEQLYNLETAGPGFRILSRR